MVAFSARFNFMVKLLSVKIYSTACANSSGKSAIKISFPVVQRIHSAPIVVEAIGMPLVQVSNILTRIPPAVLNGTTKTREPIKYEYVSYTYPGVIT